jgi:ABC-type uncharacterized transport system auxiliary subunit
MKIRFLCRLAIAFVAVCAFGGCGPSKYAKSYVLNFPQTAPSVAAAPESRGALAVREFQCPQYLCEGRIVYRPSAEEIAFYEFHRWATNPRNMVTQYVADSIRSRGLFKSVSLQDAVTEPAYVLRGSIDRLEEVDQGSVVQAVCTISAQLMNTQTKSVVWTHTATKTVPVQTRNVPGVVDGLSAAVRMSVEALVNALQDAAASSLK